MTHHAPVLAPSDSRRATRTGLFLAAILRGPLESRPVRIRNLSSKGALIELIHYVKRGDKVELIRADRKVSARVAWVRDQRCGLEFDCSIVLEEWIPGLDSKHQVAVDRRMAAVRDGLTSCSKPRLEAFEAVSLNSRIAEELALLARQIDLGLNELASYPPLVVRHAAILQNLEIVAQTLDRVAEIVNSEDPAAAIERLGMDDLKRRLLRSIANDPVWKTAL